MSGQSHEATRPSFRHGLPESSLAGSQAPAWEPIVFKLKLEIFPEAGASKTAFPSWSSHRYTQVQPSQKSRHFGRDAEI